VSDKFILGQPMLFRLEMINVSNSAITYNGQHVSLNDTLKIVRPDGKEARYIMGGFQTWGNNKTIKAEEIKVLFDNLNIDKQYGILHSGVHSVSFRRYNDYCADMEIPPSNIVEIKVLPGKPHLADQALEKIASIIPKEWRIRVFRSITIGKTEVEMLRLSLSKGTKGTKNRDVSLVDVIQVDSSRGPGSEFFSYKGDSTEYLGRNEYGHVYLIVGGNTSEYWPKAKVQIKTALGAKSK
jgi:hypothetical protein